jgi:hypothetical protein
MLSLREETGVPDAVPRWKWLIPGCGGHTVSGGPYYSAKSTRRCLQCEKRVQTGGSCGEVSTRAIDKQKCLPYRQLKKSACEHARYSIFNHASHDHQRADTEKKGPWRDSPGQTYDAAWHVPLSEVRPAYAAAQALRGADRVAGAKVRHAEPVAAVEGSRPVPHRRSQLRGKSTFLVFTFHGRPLADRNE